MIIKPIAEVVHEYLKNFVSIGDIVADCTAGKGNDTLLLSQLVGDEGKVYALDFQKRAIEATEKLLIEQSLSHRVELIETNYCKVKDYLPYGLSAVVFNLGYLPKGDHSIVSDPQDTIIALEHSMELLKEGGSVFVVVYWGHPNGAKEMECIEEFIKLPKYKGWGMYRISVPNRKKAPYLLIMEKPKVNEQK